MERVPTVSVRWSVLWRRDLLNGSYSTVQFGKVAGCVLNGIPGLPLRSLVWLAGRTHIRLSVKTRPLAGASKMLLRGWPASTRRSLRVHVRGPEADGSAMFSGT